MQQMTRGYWLSGAVVGLGLAFALAGTGPAAAADAAAPTTSVQKGVFNSAQAKRGEELYLGICAACHGEDMGGKEPAPELAGDKWMAKWEGHSAGELFNRIKTTMPQGNPGSLTEAQYIDLVAFLFDANGFPSGAAELKPDQTPGIKITAQK
jgi:quinoprotein glucose dehydrogenase